MTINSYGFRRSPIISVAAVVCGQRVDEALTMIKSVLIFNIPKYPLKIILVAEESLKRRLHETLSVWRQTCRDCFTFQVHSLSFPVEKAETWKTLFKPCAAQRLFLPVSQSFWVRSLYITKLPISDITSRRRFYFIFRHWHFTFVAGIWSLGTFY